MKPEPGPWSEMGWWGVHRHTRSIVEAAFRQPLEEIFSEFAQKPVASGSIAQVSGVAGKCASSSWSKGEAVDNT